MPESSESTLSALTIQRAPGGGARGRRKKWTRYALFGALAVIVLLVVLSILTQPVTVRVATVSTMYPSEAKQVLIASGYVVAQRKAAVASKGTGRLVELHVVEGDRVRTGDVLARIEHGDVDAGLAQARAVLEQARAAHVQAEAEAKDAASAYARAKSLLASGATAQADYDAAEARNRRAEGGVTAALGAIRAAEAAVRAAEIQVENTFIRAPFTGTVLTKDADVGEVVAPFGASANARGAVVTMADMTSLEVEADVAESQLERVSTGQPCEIALDAYPDRRYRGAVGKIVPTADRAKATVMTKIAFVDRDDRVLPEMSAKVAFLSGALDADDVNGAAKTVLPPNAVVTRHGASIAYVVVDGAVAERTLTLGANIGDMIEVLRGVKKGDKVVLNPGTRLADGARVNVAAE